jgi:phosphate transport system protein
MTRELLNQHIHQLQDEVLLLGSMIEQAILNSIDTLKQRDTEKALKIIENDHLVNDKRFAIENAVLILIATQQPMAHDLRLLTAMLEIDTELERMGDYAKSIAKIVTRLGDEQVPVPIREIERMTEVGVSMLHRALGAFIAEDAATSYQIPKEDDEVDALFNRAYRNLVVSMIANPEMIDVISLLLWVIHNLERFADRVINICERTVFICTGELIELASNDEEDSE